MLIWDFLQVITIANLDKLFANFASWGFQTNLQGGRGGQVGQGEHLTGFMLYSMLHFNFRIFQNLIDLLDIFQNLILCYILCYILISEFFRI